MKLNRRYIHLVVTAVTVLSLQATSLAEEPTSQPSRPFKGNGPVRERLNELRLNGPAANLNQQPPTEDEWNEVSAFVKDNMPNRWAMLEEIRSFRKDDAKVLQNIRQKLTNRFRQLQRAKSENQPLYDSMVDQVKKEDEVWGALQTFRKNQSDSNRETLRDKIKGLVGNLLEERQRRIDIMRENLSHEEEQLASDRDNIETVVQRRMDQVINNLDRPMADVISPGGPGGGKQAPMGPQRNDQDGKPSKSDNPR